MHKVLLSIIVPTVGREDSLSNFLNSINRIEEKSEVEIIIVDQNDDDRLIHIISLYVEKLNIKHFKFSERHANKARNFGAQHALGQWLGFADDDCMYMPNTISEFIKTLHRHNPEVILGAVRDFKGELLGRSTKKQTFVTKWNVLGKVFESNMYIQKEMYTELGGFSESFGPGSIFFSEEGLELLIRSFKLNADIYYNEKIGVTHPRDSNVAITKVEQYSFGTGAVLAKYISTWSMMMLIGFTTVFLKKFILYKGNKRRIAISRYKGILRGFITFLKKKRDS